MKLTWFGGTTIRIHLGGLILVADAAMAPTWIDQAELVSGANRVFDLASKKVALPTIDLSTWKAPRVRPLDAAAAEPTIVCGSPSVVLVHMDGERPLLLVAGELPQLGGRWIDEAVVVLLGNGAAISRRGGTLLDEHPPKLIAIAAPEPDVDFAVHALAGRLDGAGLMALEPGLGVEV